MTGNRDPMGSAAGALQRGQMLGQREEIRNAVFVEDGLRQHHVSAEEDVAGEVAELSRRMAEERDGLETNPGDLVRARLDDRVDRARHRRAGSSPAACRADRRRRRATPVAARGSGGTPRRTFGAWTTAPVRFTIVALPPKWSAWACVVSTADDVAAELFAHDLDRLLGARLVEPGVDEHDLPIVVGKYPDVDAAGHEPRRDRRAVSGFPTAFP